MPMMRYLRGKDFLDLAYDLIRRLVPNRLGTLIAGAAVLTLALAYMYVVNYPTIARWF